MHEGVRPDEAHQLILADDFPRVDEEQVEQIESTGSHPQRVIAKHQQLSVWSEPIVTETICLTV